MSKINIYIYICLHPYFVCGIFTAAWVCKCALNLIDMSYNSAPIGILRLSSLHLVGWSMCPMCSISLVQWHGMSSSRGCDLETITLTHDMLSFVVQYIYIYIYIL